jgi:hypothetical protein
MTQPKLKSEPWYTQKKKYVELADRYAKGMFVRAHSDPLVLAEVRSFARYSLVKLIYESNRIESAGLSEGETKKLIEQLPEFIFQPQLSLARAALSPELEDAVAAGKLKPTIRFEGVSRPEQEVFQHWDAVSVMMKHKLSFLDALDAGVVFPALITESLIKELHAALAAGLLPADCGVAAGEYRVDDRSIEGVDLKLPAPALLPAMMAKFVTDSQARRRSDHSPWEVAAWISYEFACIHPFPDFNGRVSRLLLALTLWDKTLISVWITLRGDAKNKHRYLTALRHANRGNLDSYTTLIAMAMVHAGEQIDANLKRAGLPSLLESGA